MGDNDSSNNSTNMTFPKAVARERVEAVPPLKITSPQDLTEDVFSRILQDYYKEPIQVASVTSEPLSLAILSQALQVNISITTKTTTPIPTSFIVKFLKPTVPLREMFRVEGAFYKHYRDHVAFFSTPTAVYCGPNVIILVKIQSSPLLGNSTVAPQHDLRDGCPPERIGQLLRGLARMHAHAWRRSRYPELSKVPGMGSALGGKNKERLFARCYPDFLNRLVKHFGQDNLPLHDRLVCLCQDLSTRRLRDIHHAAHSYTPTLVHGDFHVGNLMLLLPNNYDDHSQHEQEQSQQSQQQWFLLDWATCGAGNPLLDVVFFLIVSTHATPHELFHRWLPCYYQALIEAGDDVAPQNRHNNNNNHHDNNNNNCTTTTNNNKIQDELTYDSCVDLFRECLLDEFLILVCYDDVGRSLIARESPDTRRYFDAHFCQVNRRCAEAVLSPDMTGFPMPPHKTPAELQEEQEQSEQLEWRRQHGNNNSSKKNDSDEDAGMAEGSGNEEVEDSMEI